MDMLFLLLSAASVSCLAHSPTTLYDALHTATFYNSGVAVATDRYVWVPFDVSYMEPDNVTSPNVGWSLNSYEYMYRVAGVHHDSCTSSSHVFLPMDISGNDIGNAIGCKNVTECVALCCATPGCGAFVYEPHADVTWRSCVAGAPCCYLKSAWGTPQSKPPGFTIQAGNVTGGLVLVDPVIGMRSIGNIT